MAEVTISVCKIGQYREKFYETDVGIHELRTMIHEGHLRLRGISLLICMLGRADVKKSRRFPAVLERFIETCKTFGDHLYVILGGPFPAPFDDVNTILQLREARQYLEKRVSAEKRFLFCRSAERFGTTDGINEKLMLEDGPTVRGCEVIRRDVEDLVRSLSF